jgi:thiol-disulfide isomerase/thioredoxin
MTSTIKPFFVFLLCLMALSSLQGQTLAPYDSAYDSRINAAWDQRRAFRNQKQVQDSTHDPQRQFAPEFMNYYCDHPNTKVGQKAIESAFMMWANLRDVNAIQGAMHRLKSDSEVWTILLDIVGVAYGSNGRENDYLSLLDTLSQSLTHPRSLAQVLVTLGSATLRNSNDSLKRHYFTRVLALNADSIQKFKASQGLYEVDSLALGALAPDFIGTSVQGQPIRLSALRGTNVLLEFTGTWCLPCEWQLPFLKQAYAKRSSKNLSFVAVSRDDSVAMVLRHLGEKQISWPHILAPGGNMNYIVRKYNALAIPRIFLIDTSGRIVAKNLREEGIEAAIAKLSSQ